MPGTLLGWTESLPCFSALNFPAFVYVFHTTHLHSFLFLCIRKENHVVLKEYKMYITP